MRTVWGSEPVHDNRIIEFSVTEASDFDSKRGAMKVMGTDLGPEWDEACKVYWKRRELTVAREERVQELHLESPEEGFGDLMRRDSGAAKECASDANSDSSTEESVESELDEEEMIGQAEALTLEQKDAFMNGKEPASGMRRRESTESDLVRSLVATMFK